MDINFEVHGELDPAELSKVVGDYILSSIPADKGIYKVKQLDFTLIDKSDDYDRFPVYSVNGVNFVLEKIAEMRIRGE